MSTVISPSETVRRFAPVRAEGRIRLVFDAPEGRTRARETGEGGGFRARFPQGEGMREAVLINTGGGMTGGDKATFEMAAETGAAVMVTTQSAEKVYRSNGPDTAIVTRLAVAKGAVLHWLPQETILFSGARLTRSLEADVAAGGVLLLSESVTYGRLASGEVLGEGRFLDRWRIRRAGALVFAENLRLDGALGALLDRPALGGGARAAATLLYVAPDAESRLEEARDSLSDAVCEAGASAWNGMLAVRLLSPDPDAVRQARGRFLARFRQAPPSRVW